MASKGTSGEVADYSYTWYY